MIVPNKIIPFNESVLSKIEFVLRELSDESELIHLYHKVERKFAGIDQFLYAIDVLYALGRVSIDEPTRTVKNAG